VIISSIAKKDMPPGIMARNFKGLWVGKTFREEDEKFISDSIVDSVDDEHHFNACAVEYYREFRR